MSWDTAHNLRYRTNGTPQPNTVLDKRTVVGPASYAADGIPVDLSASFSALHAVSILRAYVTATGVADTRSYAVNEAGTDTLANRKFRIKAFAATAPGTTTQTNTWTGTASGTSCVIGCTQVHPPVPSTFTAVSGLTAPATAGTEIAGGVNLSTITIEYLVEGRPA